MGSFSWTRADTCTHRANFACGDKLKILIPQEFGGGYIQDIYYDYGRIFATDDASHTPSSYCCYVEPDGTKHLATEEGIQDADIYGMLAWMNAPEKLSFEGDTPPTHILDILKRGKTHDQSNRRIGIDIGCYAEEIEKLRYPLKMVSPSCIDSYEECYGISYKDPNQGCDNGKWTDPDYEDILEKLTQRQPDIMRRFVIEELAFPVDGYTHNAQVWTSVDHGKTYAYCGIGKTCRSEEECKRYFAEYKNSLKIKEEQQI